MNKDIYWTTNRDLQDYVAREVELNEEFVTTVKETGSMESLFDPIEADA